jgi:hypothetical protein
MSQSCLVEWLSDFLGNILAFPQEQGTENGFVPRVQADLQEVPKGLSRPFCEVDRKGEATGTHRNDPSAVTEGGRAGESLLFHGRGVVKAPRIVEILKDSQVRRESNTISGEDGWTVFYHTEANFLICGADRRAGEYPVHTNGEPCNLGSVGGGFQHSAFQGDKLPFARQRGKLGWSVPVSIGESAGNEKQ